MPKRSSGTDSCKTEMVKKTTRSEVGGSQEAAATNVAFMTKKEAGIFIWQKYQMLSLRTSFGERFHSIIWCPDKSGTIEQAVTW